MSYQRKSVQTLQKISAPFSENNFDFEEYVCKFTTAFSRLHTMKNIYKESEFHPATVEIYNRLATKDVYNIHTFPKTFEYVGMDSPEEEADLAANYWYFGRSVRSGSDKSTVLDRLMATKNRQRFKKIFEIDGVSKKEWYEEIFPKFTYSVNSTGLRTPFEIEDLEENKFIPVFGCSHTFGLGSPYEHLWHTMLNEDLPIFNVGISGTGVTEVYLLLKKLYKEKPFKKTYICIPHRDRFCAVTKAGVIEGLLGSFVSELSSIQLNNDTISMYANISYDALVMFCKEHGIELHIYFQTSLSSCQRYIDWDLPAPPHYSRLKTVLDLKTVNDCKIEKHDLPNYVARDLIHNGKYWHENMAKLLTNQ